MSQTLWAFHTLDPTLLGCLTLARAPQEKGGEPEPSISPQQLFKGAAGPALGIRHHGTKDTAAVAAAAGGGLASGSTACAPHLLLPNADPEP